MIGAPHQVVLVSHWPTTDSGAQIITPIGSSDVGAAGDGLTVTLAAVAGLTTYLTDLTISCTEVLAEVSGLITIAGLPWAWNLQYVESRSTGGLYDHHYDPPLPASGPNTPIVLTVPVIDGGGAVAVNMMGYQA